MNLATSASERSESRIARPAAGYAMAGLLVAMSVMAILLSVALPTWSQMIRREKEEELIFRGNQYARAINLYQRKFANASPPTLDVLVEQRMLRKKYKDPLSPNKDGEFQLLYLQSTPTGGSTAPSMGPSRGGLIVGVASKNTGTSIRVFNGKTRYNEWQFIGMQQSQRGGTGAQGSRGVGPRGGGPQRGDGRGDFRGRMGSPQR